MPQRRSRRDSSGQQADPLTVVAGMVQDLFAARCKALKLDPNHPDFWQHMCLTFVLQHHLLPKPEATKKETKPRRWGGDDDRRLLEGVEKKVAAGKSVSTAINELIGAGTVLGKPKSVETRYYEAKQRQKEARRNSIAAAQLAQSSPPSPSSASKAKKVRRRTTESIS